jgi:hypothetical protein
MSVPTAFQLARLRQRPQETILHLAIYQPRVLATGIISHPGIAKGAVYAELGLTTIIDTVPANSVMYVGTRSQGFDKGRVRVRSFDSANGIVHFGRNDHIQWEDGLFITIVDFIEPQGIFHRIVLEGTDDVTFYRDYDLTYSDQNRLIRPIANMGGNRTVFVGDSITWDAGESYSPIGASITGYAWSFTGGDISSATGEEVTVTYNTPGSYRTRMTVTDSNGKVTTGTRYVCVLNGPHGGVQGWGLDSLNGSREQGGWQANLWVRSDITRVKPGSLVMIIAEDWYNGEKLQIPNNMVFCGYVTDESLSFDWRTNKVSFEALSITGVAKGRETFGVALDSVAAGAEGNWTQMANITTDKALVNYLKYNTTLTDIADFHPTEDTKKKKFADLPHGPIYDTVQSYLESNLLASFVADRDGDIWCEVDLNYVPSGSRTAPIGLYLEKKDWRGEPEIQRTMLPGMSYVEAGGIYYTGTAEEYTAYLSGAPGDVPGYHGNPERISGLVLSSQAQLNQLAGDIYAQGVSEFPRVTYPLAGHYRTLDIAPQERVAVTLDSADNYLGLEWEDKLFIPVGIDYEYNPKTHTLMASLEAKEETSGFPGDTIIIPVDPPDGAEDPGDDPVGLPFPPTPGSAQTVYACYRNYILRTRDFQSTPPTWEVVCSIGDHKDFILDPHDPRNSAWLLLTTGQVYYCSDLDETVPTWNLKLSGAILGSTATNIHAAVGQQGLVYVLGKSASDARGHVWHSTDYGDNWTMGGRFPGFFEYYDHWIDVSDRNPGTVFAVTAGWAVHKSTNYGMTWTNLRSIGSIFNWSSQIFLPYEGNESDQIIIVVSNDGTGNTTGTVWKSTNGGSTWTDITPVGSDGKRYGGGGMQYVMTGNLNHLHLFGQLSYTESVRTIANFFSSDGGNTWEERFVHVQSDYNYYSGIGMWPYNSQELFMLTSDSGGPIYSLDGGYTWNGKEGNILTLVGGASILAGAGVPRIIVPVWI